MTGTRWLLLAPAGSLLGVVVVALVSDAAQSLGAFSLTGDGALSLDAYRSLAADQPVIGSLLVGGAVAGTATALAAVVGLVTVAVLRASRRGSRLLGGLMALTVPVPHLVSAAAVALLLSDSGLVARLAHAPPGGFPAWVGGPWFGAVVLELAWKESAFIGLVVLASLPGDLADRDEALSMLGADPWRRWRTVTLPASRTALVVASTVAFVYALGSFEVAWLLGPALPETMPETAYRLFTSTELSLRPEAFAATVVLTVTCLAATLVGLSLLRRPSRVSA